MGRSRLRLVFEGVVVSKKNSKVIRVNRRTGAHYITSNDIAKANEAEMVAQFREQVAKLRGFRAGEFAPCSLELKIWEPDLKRRDLDNQLTSILDALVKAEVIEDDSVDLVRGFVVEYGGVDAERPRVEIVVRKVEAKKEARSANVHKGLPRAIIA